MITLSTATLFHLFLSSFSSPFSLFFSFFPYGCFSISSPHVCLQALLRAAVRQLSEMDPCNSSGIHHRVANHFLKMIMHSFLFMGLFCTLFFYFFFFFLFRCLGLRLCKDLIVGNIIACLLFPRVMLVSLKTQWLKRDNGIHHSKLGIVNKLFLL